MYYKYFTYVQAQVEDLVGKSILVECIVILGEDVYES